MAEEKEKKYNLWYSEQKLDRDTDFGDPSTFGKLEESGEIVEYNEMIEVGSSSSWPGAKCLGVGEHHHTDGNE